MHLLILHHIKGKKPQCPALPRAGTFRSGDGDLGGDVNSPQLLLLGNYTIHWRKARWPVRDHYLKQAASGLMQGMSSYSTR